MSVLLSGFYIGDLSMRAGFGVLVPLIDLSGEKWRSVHAVTLAGVFYGVKHGARQMLEQDVPASVSINGSAGSVGPAARTLRDPLRRHPH